MKKLSLLFVCILTIVSCNQDLLIEEVPLEKAIESYDVYAKQGNKVAVCHRNGKIIFVNENAIPAHTAHGDAVDMDGDGFFDQENSCFEGVDCDDTNADVNPDAEEIFTDDIDNNCNGVVGYIQTTIEMGPCSNCTGTSFGYYQNPKGRCFQTPHRRTQPCTVEVVAYID